jgi:hypothetical protein
MTCFMLKGNRTTLTNGSTLQFRFESITALNHPLFPGPITNPPPAASFGQIVTSAQTNYPRRTQVLVKFLF